MSRYSWLHEGTESAPITRNDLEQLENYADRLFAKVGIDVEFTRHFLDRVNDERNQRQITMAELTRLFKQEFKRYGKKIASMGPDAEAVMKDMKTDVNMPFVLQWDPTNQELDLVAKTVMRKKDFKTSNPEFAVEAWSEKYKKSIDCNNPKGFSQKAHCAGKKKNNEEIEETSPFALAKRFIDPVIKHGSYEKAAKTLYDILRRKKQEDGKLRHGIAYYAQQLAKSFAGVDYRALEDYLRDHYDVAQFESKFTPMELAIMEGGHSLNDINKKVLTPEQQKIVEKLQSTWLSERLVKLDPKGPSNLKKPQKKSKYSKRKDAFSQSDSDDLNDSIYEKLQNKWMLENPEELDEGWKETLGSLAIASSLALGSMGAMTVKQALDSPKFTPSEKVEIFKAANLPANQLPDELKLATPEPRPDGEYKPITNSKNELILLSAAKKAGLKGTELAAFMAQMAHESENFKDMVEDNPNIKKYGTGRTAKALGNKNVTDGERFIGRGFIQLTGRWNYEWMQKSLGIDLTSTWSKAHQASKPEVAAQIALEFWKQRVRPKVSDWSDVAQVTKPINKALHGLDHREARFEKIMLAMNEDEGQDLNTQRGRLGYYLKQPKVKKDVGIHLGKLPKYHDGEDELAKLVPERNGIYALHPDSWESTFYSLTNKDFKKITRYQPAIVKIPNDSIVADMAIANQFYRTKDPVEKQKFAKAYKDSIVPYGSDISHIKMPEIIMPRLVESLVELKIEKPDPEDTMGIKRNQMPQIATDDYPEFIDYLRDNGASFTKASVDPNSLNAIQGEFSDAGVIKALQKSKIEKPIIASNDNYIIDGHHRWVAALNTGVDVNIYRVNKPVKELLQLVKDFPKTTYKDIYEAVGIITAQNTTKDVKPGETQRQAAKFGMQLDKNNNPPLLHKKAAKNSKSNKLFNLGIA